MMKRRSEQVRALGDAMRRQFEARLLQYLLSGFANRLKGRSEDQIVALVRQGIDESKQYDVVDETDVCRYIEYMVLYGADFHQRLPWAGEVLRTNGPNGTEKMDRIDNQALFVRPEPVS